MALINIYVVSYVRKSFNTHIVYGLLFANIPIPVFDLPLFLIQDNLWGILVSFMAPKSEVTGSNPGLGNTTLQYGVEEEIIL